MRGVFNQYSLVWIGVTLLAIAVAVSRRSRRRWLRYAVPGGLLAVLLTAFLLLRTGGGNVHSAADLDTALAAGKPVLLELYSDY